MRVSGTCGRLRARLSGGPLVLERGGTLDLPLRQARRRRRRPFVAARPTCKLISRPARRVALLVADSPGQRSSGPPARRGAPQNGWGPCQVLLFLPRRRRSRTRAPSITVCCAPNWAARGAPLGRHFCSNFSGPAHQSTAAAQQSAGRTPLALPCALYTLSAWSQCTQSAHTVTAHSQCIKSVY